MIASIRRLVWSATMLTAFTLAALSPPAVAQTPVRAPAQASPSGQATPYELSPTLAQIKRTRTVRIGYRENAPPFSFIDRDGRIAGYSLELCDALIPGIAAEIDERELKREFVRVTAESRVRAVTENAIDLECGSTTFNPERAAQVAFSPLIYLTGTRLLVPGASRIDGIEDMAGKTIVVTRGTTNEEALREADKKRSLNLKIITGNDHDQSFQMLADGKADAFATDEILLNGLLSTQRGQGRFRVVGEYLSYESYGILFRKDERQLNTVIDHGFRDLAARRVLQTLYDKWFRAGPNGNQLNIPMPAQLEATFRRLAEPLPGGR